MATTLLQGQHKGPEVSLKSWFNQFSRRIQGHGVATCQASLVHHWLKTLISKLAKLNRLYGSSPAAWTHFYLQIVNYPKKVHCQSSKYALRKRWDIVLKYHSQLESFLNFTGRSYQRSQVKCYLAWYLSASSRFDAGLKVVIRAV